MEQNKVKVRYILQYYYDKGKNASEAVSISTAQRWFQRFRSGVKKD